MCRNLDEFHFFFQLPREIRDQIYLLLCGYNEIVGRTYADKGSTVIRIASELPEHWQGSSWKSMASQLQQLQVSRQFYEEAAMIFYSSSSFECFSNPGSFAPFLSALHPKFQSRIRHLSLKIDATQTDPQLWGKLFKEYAVTRFSSLRVICIYVWVDIESGVTTLPTARFYSSKSLPVLEEATVFFDNIRCPSLAERSFPPHQQDMIFQAISEWLT